MSSLSWVRRPADMRALGAASTPGLHCVGGLVGYRWLRVGNGIPGRLKSQLLQHPAHYPLSRTWDEW